MEMSDLEQRKIWNSIFYIGSSGGCTYEIEPSTVNFF